MSRPTRVEASQDERKESPHKNINRPSGFKPAWGIGACSAHSVSRLQFLSAADWHPCAAIVVGMETHFTSSERNESWLATIAPPYPVLN
jgi:hypothetical protein